MAKLRGTPGDDGSYAAKVRRYYGIAGSNSFPAPGSNGPAQMLYEHHTAYTGGGSGEGSDSWPGSANPTTMRTRQ